MLHGTPTLPDNLFSNATKLSVAENFARTNNFLIYGCHCVINKAENRLRVRLMFRGGAKEKPVGGGQCGNHFFKEREADFSILMASSIPAQWKSIKVVFKWTRSERESSGRSRITARRRVAVQRHNCVMPKRLYARKLKKENLAEVKQCCEVFLNMEFFTFCVCLHEASTIHTKSFRKMSTLALGTM